MYRYPETTAIQHVTAIPQTFAQNKPGRGANCNDIHSEIKLWICTVHLAQLAEDCPHRDSKIIPTK